MRTKRIVYSTDASLQNTSSCCELRISLVDLVVHALSEALPRLMIGKDVNRSTLYSKWCHEVATAHQRRLCSHVVYERVALL